MDIDEDSIAACHVLPVINKNDNGEENENKKKQSPGIIIRFVYLNIVDSIYQRKKNLSKMTDDEKVDFDIITVVDSQDKAPSGLHYSCIMSL